MAVVALGLAGLIAAGCWVVFMAARTAEEAGSRRMKPLLTVDRPFPAGGRFPGDPYIGTRACAECHPGESAHFSRSGHALTLRPVGRRTLAARLDGVTVADPETPAVRWSYRFRDGRLRIARQAPDQVENWIAEYAIGSGHHATTFVTLLDPSIPSLLEHRLTYYMREHTLGMTPGQNFESKTVVTTPHGSELGSIDTRRCFDCHSTQISARGNSELNEETMIPNVSCERCHGPGRAHVEAARRGATESELALRFGPDRWTADSLMKLCGSCHRHPSKARPGQIRPDDPHLARFQPVGIMQSKCYRESGGAFSCVNCHDPHARASAGRASYDATCVECHATGRDSSAKPAQDHRSSGAPCPISPGGGCVECHMPRVNSGQHVLFTDHWIRVRRRGEASSTDLAPTPNLDLFDPDAQ